MKKRLLIFLLNVFSMMAFSQARLVFNDDAYMNIDNNAYLVVHNGNANAISLLGTGGNILSENERDVVKWNVGNATGNYKVPFTNTNHVKIPVEINIVAAGSSGGSLILSTYRTDNMNSQWPNVSPAVTNMCSPFFSTDASLVVMDRFWRVDANSYSTKPAVVLSFGYDFDHEAVGANVIGEPKLRAQRFNPNIGTVGATSCHGTNVTGNWEYLLFGTANVLAKKVENVAANPASFFKDWILVDNATPLPITLVSFDATCESGVTVLNWSTGSEKNNDYFVIEKSTDAINFSPIGTIQGNGNSSGLLHYSYRDISTNFEISYYRLKQVDYNGKETHHDVTSSSCDSGHSFIVSQEVFLDNSLNFSVHADAKESLTIKLYDYSGKLHASKKTNVDKGNNHIELSGLTLVKGIYILSIVGERNYYTTKLFKQ